MSGAPHIEILRADDAGRAARLHAACFEGAERWNVRAIRESLSLATTLGLGVETGGELTGLILVQKVRPDAEILTLCVHPDARRSGQAQALFDHMIRLLGPYGIDRLLLDVAADNAPALAFYGTNGFGRDGVRRNYYRRDAKKAVDGVLMSRSLAGQTGHSQA